ADEIQKVLFRHPPTLLYQFLFHHRDVCSRTTKCDKAEAKEDAGHFLYVGVLIWCFDGSQWSMLLPKDEVRRRIFAISITDIFARETPTLRQYADSKISLSPPG